LTSLQRRSAKDPAVIERRIGRWLGRVPVAERLVEVTVQRDAHNQACGLSIIERTERTTWAEQGARRLSVTHQLPGQRPG
jgi:hypothetical protein